MDYEEFKEQFISAVKESLYEQGSDMNVSVNEVKKLNESYEAMTVTPEGARVGVNIGIERFYDAYNEGRPFDEVVDKAVDTINHGINERPDFDIDSFTDYEQMKEELEAERKKAVIRELMKGPDLERYLEGKKRKFITYAQGARMFSMNYYSFVRLSSLERPVKMNMK